MPGHKGAARQRRIILFVLWLQWLAPLRVEGQARVPVLHEFANRKRASVPPSGLASPGQMGLYKTIPPIPGFAFVAAGRFWAGQLSLKFR
jgi:hypothetical protein